MNSSVFVIFLLFFEINLVFSHNCSNYEKSYKEILTRKKRFLIFGKGGAVIHSSGFGKQIIAGFPRGFNWILELDMFWPLPFQARVFTQSKDLLFGKNKPKINIPTWLQNQPKTPSYSTYKLFLTPQATTPMPMTTKKPTYYDTFYQNPWESHAGEIFVPNRRSWRMLNDKKVDPDPRWNNYYAHKDRKDLFEIIQKGYLRTGANTTACLQRTICEAKYFLLPKGKSLLHDVFRIIFSYPTHADDDWAEAARAKNPQHCQEIYSKDCPMSLLDFFLHSGHIF